MFFRPLLAAFLGVILLLPVGELHAQDEDDLEDVFDTSSLTDFQAVNRELSSFLRQHPPVVRATRANLARVERANELDEDWSAAAGQANPDALVNAANASARQAHEVFGDVRATFTDCIIFYRLSTAMSVWYYASRALQAAERSHRACQQLPGMPLMKVLAGARHGVALRDAGRDAEGRAQLQRAFDTLRRGRFADAPLSIRVAGDYAETLARIGEAEEGRDRLIELQRALATRTVDAGDRVELLTALSGNALWRSSPYEAEQWAALARPLALDPAISSTRSWKALHSLASARIARDGNPIRALEPDQDIVALYRRREPNSVSMLVSLLNEAIALHSANRGAEADERLAEVLALAPRVVIPPPFRPSYFSLLANYYASTRRCPEWLEAASALQALANDGTLDARWASSATATSASALQNCGRAGEAVRLLEASAPSRQRPPGDWDEISRRWLLSLAYVSNRQFEGGIDLRRRLCSEMEDAAASSMGRPDRHGYSTQGLTQSRASCYLALSDAYWRWSREAPGNREAMLEQAFLAAQAAIQSDPDDGISFSLGLEAARAQGPQTAALVLEYEALRRRLGSVQRAFEDRLVADDSTIADPQTALRAREAELRAAINRRFPDYWRARLPQTFDLAALQGRGGQGGVLRPGEALLLVSIDASDYYENLVFAVSREGFAAARIDMAPEALRALIAQVRGSIFQPPRPGTRGFVIPDFDLTAANRLYRALFSDPAIRRVVEPARVLLYVPTGTLRQLPLGVLITGTQPDGAMARTERDYRTASWLIRDKAVAVFPTLSSLVRLRQRPAGTAGPSRTPFLAFAEPDFGGGLGSGVPTRGSLETRTGEAALSGYPLLDPLGGKGIEEMQGVAAAIGARTESIVTGPAASEESLMRRDAAGELRDTRMLGFATHGLLPGALPALQEPALALSRPRTPAPHDGLLTASEISGLSLDADLVLLSACESGSLEAGRSVVALSRAFLQAGARSLLLTYWPVPNEVGPRLLPFMFQWRRDHPEMSSAEALQAAALETMRNSGIDGWVPFAWAAYVLVGDAELR